MTAGMVRTRVSGPKLNMTGKTVELMRMRKTRMKFTDNYVTSEGAGLNGWFNGKG
jgi:hypothetical protein